MLQSTGSQKVGHDLVTEQQQNNITQHAVTQLCPTFCNPMDCSPPGSWSGLPSPPPGDLSNPGIYPRSPALQADSLPAEPPGKPSSSKDFPDSSPFSPPYRQLHHLLSGLEFCRSFAAGLFAPSLPPSNPSLKILNCLLPTSYPH